MSEKKKVVRKKRAKVKKKKALLPGEGTPRPSEPTPKQPKKVSTGDMLRRVALDVTSCVIPVTTALLAAGCAYEAPGIRLTAEVIKNLKMKDGVHQRKGVFIANLVPAPAMRELAKALGAPITFDERAWKRIYPER